MSPCACVTLWVRLLFVKTNCRLVGRSTDQWDVCLKLTDQHTHTLVSFICRKDHSSREQGVLIGLSISSNQSGATLTAHFFSSFGYRCIFSSFYIGISIKCCKPLNKPTGSKINCDFAKQTLKTKLEHKKTKTKYDLISWRIVNGNWIRNTQNIFTQKISVCQHNITEVYWRIKRDLHGRSSAMSTVLQVWLLWLVDFFIMRSPSPFFKMKLKIHILCHYRW